MSHVQFIFMEVFQGDQFEASTTCHDHIPYTAISPQPMAPQLELHG
jgi:hypothetical protein